MRASRKPLQGMSSSGQKTISKEEVILDQGLQTGQLYLCDVKVPWGE